MLEFEDIELILKARQDFNLEDILDKAGRYERLSLEEIGFLLKVEDEKGLKSIYDLAGQIKDQIYGKRVVMFAPLYISDFCVNSCSYCGYNTCNDFNRKKLNQDQIREEVKALSQMGHKRIALEAGEDDINCNLDYILQSIDTIYSTELEDGVKIRRINVNIAATSIENYRRLKEKDIGTYILFQETYKREVYEQVHLGGPKKNYRYHLEAFDRAMEAGIEDVGGGVLFGLYDYKFEVLSLIKHNNYLEENYKAGFHTVSVPRLKKAKGMELEDFKHIISDEEFKKIVAILRIALPYTGIIVSTRETGEMRAEVINYGVSQVSGGSSTEVGGYKTYHEETQFKVSDSRTLDEIIEDLIDHGFIPSFCTGCYRMGRTGEEFFDVVHNNKIKDLCTPNAILTLYEYSLDFLDEAFQAKVESIIKRELKENNNLNKQVLEGKLEEIKNGKRDLYF